MSLLLAALPLVPLGAALVIAIAGRRLGERGGLVAVGAVASSPVLLALLGKDGPSTAVQWLSLGRFELRLGLELDALSLYMAWVVAAVALPVTVYAVRYVADGPDKARFFAVHTTFVGSMLILVLADSLVTIFLAWEAVGVCSFLLIGHRHQDREARRAAARAFLATRAADLGFLLAWILVWIHVGSTDVATFLDFVRSGALDPWLLHAIAFGFLVAALGKSAQLPFSFWLPQAMAAPTPVSALLHSATMVAAGVYLVLRVYPVFESSAPATAAMLFAGTFTAILGAFLAVSQSDIKRLLAWSTVSQLGEMFLALGLASPLGAAFHLATHAAFKSALFLTAGHLDHCAGSRRLDELGALRKPMPRTAASFGIAALALAGIPPLSGYWSEEHILAAAVERGLLWGVVMLALVGLAGLYIGRAGMSIFGSWPGAGRSKAADCGPWMDAPMIVLALGAAGLGLAMSRGIAGWLPFEEGSELSWWWRIAAVALALGGLAGGALRVRARGPVPFARSGALESGLRLALDGPARSAGRLARGLESAENLLDAGARGLAGLVASVASSLSFLGAATDTGVHRLTRLVGAGDSSRSLARAIDAAEAFLDRSVQRAGAAAAGSAALVDRGEEGAWKTGGDSLGRALLSCGDRLRATQSGKLYLYTLALFLWVLGAALAALFWW